MALYFPVVITPLVIILWASWSKAVTNYFPFNSSHFVVFFMNQLIVCNIRNSDILQLWLSNLFFMSRTLKYILPLCYLWMDYSENNAFPFLLVNPKSPLWDPCGSLDHTLWTTILHHKVTSPNVVFLSKQQSRKYSVYYTVKPKQEANSHIWQKPNNWMLDNCLSKQLGDSFSFRWPIDQLIIAASDWRLPLKKT